MFRPFVALAAAGALALIPLGAASASSTTAKRIAYVAGADLITIGANGTGTTNLGQNPASVSFSTNGQLIVFDEGGQVKSIPSSGGSATDRCAGSDPAISPDGQRVAYVLAGDLKADPLACGAATDLVPGTSVAESDPAWSPDGTQIVFVEAGNLAVAPGTGGAAQQLGSTSGVESDPAWSPDGLKIAYISGGELFVMNADGSSRQQLTSNTVDESSPSWAPGGDEIAYAAGGNLYAIAANGSSIRQLQDASGATNPDWGFAVANTTPPPIAPAVGPYTEGMELSAGVGTWTSISGITSWTYQWKRCGSSGTGCVSISGATVGTYTLTTSDIGSTVRVTVTATTSDGFAPGTSAPTGVVQAAAPQNVTPPTITGTPVVGETLTASPGTWSGTNPVFTYQWQKCDASGTEASCANVAGATGNVYVPVTSDVGSTFRVVVTATNTIGSATKASNPTPVIASKIPANVSPPAIAVSTSFDQSIYFTATTGVWTGSPTIAYRYQWRRCNPNGTSCVDIAGAVTSTYTPVTADIGSRLRLAVTATNSYGTATAVSEPTDVLAGTAPVNTFPPSISGLAESGSILSANNGSWTGSTPLTYTFEWRRCNSAGASCGVITGSTSQTYIVQTVDVGARIVVAVTAKNAAGTATAVSPPTALVQAATIPIGATRPSATKSPSFTGVLAKGKTLVAVNGTWSGTTPMTFSYQWQRCAATAATCTPIALATRSTYVLTAADVGKRIRLAVTAANVAGSTQELSSISKPVAAKAPAASGKTLRGSAKADTLVGGPGADTIHGGAGNDRISGKAGADKLYGDAGNDRIDAGAGLDRIYGGTGNDTILARDGKRDVIDCGSGRDTVIADKVDVVKGCETVKRV